MPVTFSGNNLKVNAWTRFGGEIRIEVADDATGERSRKQAASVPGRALQDCDPISGDRLDHIVTWNGQSDLSAWAGKPVRLRLYMRRARLHSLQFVN